MSWGPEIGYLPIMPVNARNSTGTSRDKTGTRQGHSRTNRDKEGKIGTVPFCPCLSLLVPTCPCLSLLVPVSLCLFLLVHVCPFLSLSVPVCPCLSVSVPVWQCLSWYVSTFPIPAFPPLQMIITVKNSNSKK